MTHALHRSARSRQRGIGLLAIVVATLVMLGLSVAVVSEMRTSNVSREANVSDAQKALAAVSSLRAALAECVLNYPLAATGPEVSRAVYVLFDATAANAAASAASTPNTVPADVPLAEWPTKLFCPGRNNSGTALSLWVGANAGFPVPSATRVALSLRMGRSDQTAAQRPGSLYLVVGCGTAGEAAVAKAVLDDLGVNSTSFACGTTQEVLLAP